MHRDGAARALVQGAVLPGLSFLVGDLGLARTTATSGALLLSIDAIATVLLSALFLRERLSPGCRRSARPGHGGHGPRRPERSRRRAGRDGGLGDARQPAGTRVGARRCGLRRLVAPHGQPADEGVGRTAWQFLGATLAVLPFVLGSWWTGGSRIATAEPHQLVAAAAVLLCGLGALLAFNVGIGTVSASRAGLLYTLQPLAGALTAVTLLGEPVVAGQALGAALILACLVVLTRDGTGRSDPTPDLGRGRGPHHEMRHTMATRSPLFCDTALARRIERAETGLIADTSRATQARTGTEGFLIPIAGGMASFAEPDSPFNKVVGLGLRRRAGRRRARRDRDRPSPPRARRPRSSSPTSPTRRSASC